MILVKKESEILSLDKSWTIWVRFNDRKQIKKLVGFNLVSLILEDNQNNRQTYNFNVIIPDTPKKEVKKAKVETVVVKKVEKKENVVSAWI